MSLRAATRAAVIAAFAVACALPCGSAAAACRVQWIEAGTRASLAGDEAGVTWGWGEPQPLGLGTRGPAEIGGLAACVAASAGLEHGLALTLDRRVMGWGRNTLGQLGASVPAGSLASPGILPGSALEPLTDVFAVAGGDAHSLALRGDGRVLAWGSDLAGQLGRAAVALGDADPGVVDGLFGVLAIDAAGDRSVALLADGTAWSWGDGFLGELGDGTLAASDLPARATGLPLVNVIAAGRYHTLARAMDGGVWAWGWNGHGELGSGVPLATVAATPVLVPGIVDAIGVAAGDGTSFALLADGSVVAWGDNARGSLGPMAPRATGDPVLVPLPAPADRLAAGAAHALALLRDGTVRAWGSNERGELGLPPIERLAAPATVALPGPAAAVFASRGDQSQVRLQDGRIFSWGDDRAGELGLGLGSAAASVPDPLEATALAGIVTLASGADHALGLMPDGSLRAWGDNTVGQVGDGTRSAALAPVAVSAAGVALATCAGAYHSLALRDDGTIAAWGDNALGQLGDGSGSWDSTSPVDVAGVGDAASIACGSDHSLASLATGEVVAWGLNGAGQLGDGTLTLRETPVIVAGVDAPVALAAGRAHSLALMQDGRVLAWGASDGGRLGIEPRGAVAAPVVVPGLPADLVAIAAGDDFSVALRADGSVLAWGVTGLAQQAGRAGHEPFTVGGLPPVDAVAAGAGHVLALASDGSVWSWGDARLGQCGTGVAAWSADAVDPGFVGPAGEVALLMARKDPAGVALSWIRAPSAASYNVRRSPTPLVADSTIVATPTAAAHLDAPPAGSIWHYVVTVVDCAGGEGD